MKPLRAIFMGTPDFAVPALAEMLRAGHEIAAVYTQPPRPKGRGQNVQNTPVHEFAAQHGLPVRYPKSLKSQDAQDEFAALNADVCVVAAYGLILPKAVLEAPRFGCLNIHASLLPRWRGASPIQRAIWAGDAQTGITIMQMDEGLDTGAMIAQRGIPITLETTAPDLHDALAAMGGEMIAETLARLSIDQTRLPAEPQPESGITYAHLLKKEDGRVDWSQSAEDIDRQIRALNPWPGVWTMLNGKIFKIKNASPGAQNSSAKPGTVLDKNGHVACGGGSTIKLDQIQPEGKKPMAFGDAVNGGYLKSGDILG